MAWWLLGRESKTERQLRELREQVRPQAGGEIELPEAHPDGGENQISPLDEDGTPFVQLRAEWDAEREGFVIDIDWNAPFLKHIIAMGVEGETDFEVAAYGAGLMSNQIIETEMIRRANEQNQILAMTEDDLNDIR